jgi:hypothetical protein
MPLRRTFAASAASLAPALWLVSVLGGSAADQKPRVNADAALSVEFLNGVQQYVELHRKLESTLPPRQEQATPAEVQAHETALADLIARARARAEQGDLLPQHIRAYLRRQIGRAIAGPEGRALRESIMEDNPAQVRLRVNSRYPDGIPRTTMPPPILGALPKLPEHLEYRFIGPRLVLLDSHAQLVVDYMDGALPK